MEVDLEQWQELAERHQQSDDLPAADVHPPYSRLGGAGVKPLGGVIMANMPRRTSLSKFDLSLGYLAGDRMAERDSRPLPLRSI